ncbi:MAG: hypothetical protein ACLP8A_15395 [Methylovirgula sp.]
MTKKFFRSILLAYAAFALSAAGVAESTVVANAAVFPSGPNR